MRRDANRTDVRRQEPYKPRPVVLVGRGESYQVRTHVLVAPINRRLGALDRDQLAALDKALRYALALD